MTILTIGMNGFVIVYAFWDETRCRMWGYGMTLFHYEDYQENVHYWQAQFRMKR